MSASGPPPAESREPSIRVIMMPKDTNAHGTIFGGVILSYIDQAGAVEAKRQGADFLVTVAMREVVSQPGEGLGNRVKVTEAEVTYVNLDKNRRPVPIGR